MSQELTLIFFKPDAVEKNIVFETVKRFEEAGLKVVSFKFDKITNMQFDEHYGHVAGKFFYEDMRKFITSNKLTFIVLKGENAIQRVRDMIGLTLNAPLGTIRGDYGSDGFHNLIHASDSYESAIKEIARFFYS